MPTQDRQHYVPETAGERLLSSDAPSRGLGTETGSLVVQEINAVSVETALPPRSLNLKQLGRTSSSGPSSPEGHTVASRSVPRAQM